MNAAEKRKIMEHISGLGCTRREAAVFLDLSVSGLSTVQEISRRLGENRVTVHSAAEQLLEKGLLIESRREKRRLLAAQEPGSLLRLVTNEEQKLALAKSHAVDAMELLRNLPRETRSTPKLRLYHGAEGLTRMLDESLAAKTEIMVVTDVEMFAGILGRRALESYYQRRKEAGIHSRLIWSDCEFANTLAPNLQRYSMEVRISPAEGDWQVGFFSWDDTVAIKSLAEGAVTCTILQNQGISEFYRSIIFESLWRDAKPLTAKNTKGPKSKR